MDMYSPYISLIKACFPNAQIVFDRFHIVNLLSRALNKTRIIVMNNKKELYNKFKNYYKLLLKPFNELDRTHITLNVLIK
jgi:transposase